MKLFSDCFSFRAVTASFIRISTVFKRSLLPQKGGTHRQKLRPKVLSEFFPNFDSNRSFCILPNLRHNFTPMAKNLAMIREISLCYIFKNAYFYVIQDSEIQTIMINVYTHF